MIHSLGWCVTNIDSVHEIGQHVSMIIGVNHNEKRADHGRLLTALKDIPDLYFAQEL